jgi:hypothetical protein
MNKLNATTTKVFLLFLLKIQGLDEKKISVKDHALLRLKKGQIIQTEEGPGFVFSIGLVAPDNPEKYSFCMTFIVIDRRSETHQRLDLSVFPVSIQDDINDVQEDSVRLNGGCIESFNLTYQRSHAKAAYPWLLELKTAGYAR